MVLLLCLRAIILCLIIHRWTDAFEVRTCDDWSATCMADQICSSKHKDFVEKCGKVNLSSSTCPDGCKNASEHMDSDAKHYCPCHGLKVSPWTSQYTLSLDCDDFSGWFGAQCGSASTVKPHFSLILLISVISYISTR